MLIKQYHRRHPLNTIKVASVEQEQHQPNWVADAPNSELNQSDLSPLISTLQPYSVPTPTPCISSKSSKLISGSTLHISTIPNTLTFVKKQLAPYTDKCQTKHLTSHPSPPADDPSRKAVTRSPALSPSSNASPPSLKPLPPNYPMSSSLTKNHRPFASLVPHEKPSKNFPHYPLEQLKYSSACTPTSTRPSTPSPMDSL